MAACGCDFTLAVMQDGSVFAWGRGADAQLGLPACEDRLAPARVGAQWTICVMGGGGRGGHNSPIILHET